MRTDFSEGVGDCRGESFDGSSGGLDGFVSCQDEYSLVARGIERELIPAMTTHGLGLLPFFPLASGLLTGKYKRGEPPAAHTRFATRQGAGDRFGTDANFALVDKLAAFAAARGHSMLDLAFAGLASRPLLASVMAGATSAEQVEQNVKAVDW